jgi:hypothetical protein
MGCNEFSSAKVGNRIQQCKMLKASLWLRHTKEYSYINAYNLAVMATLAYSRVDPNKHGEGIVETGDVADFYKKCAKKMKFSVTNKETGGATPVNPFFRYGETEGKDTPLIEPHELKWFVDIKDGFIDGNSTEAFFFVDDKHAVVSVRGTSEIWMDGVVIDGDAAPVRLPELQKAQKSSKSKEKKDETPMQLANVKGYLHRGFATQAMTIIKDDNFKDFVKQAKSKKLFVTGHSLGGAVATILAAYLKEKGCDPLLYTYGSPRVGNETFVMAYSSITHYRHVYHRDPVPMVPTKRLFMSTHDFTNMPYIAGSLILSRYLNPDIGDYIHHGTLCQIARVGGEDMILPFESHGIVGEHIYRQLTQKTLAKELLTTQKPAEHIMEQGNNTQAYQYLLNKHIANSSVTDTMEDGAMVGEMDLLQIQDAWGKIDIKSSATDHFMKESYLPFFQKEIRRLWSIYKNNGCEEVQWYAGRRYDRALESIETRLQKIKETQAHSVNYLQKVQDFYRKQISDLESAKREILSYKQKKIGTKTLYSLYTGDPELNLQLDKF